MAPPLSSISPQKASNKTEHPTQAHLQGQRKAQHPTQNQIKATVATATAAIGNIFYLRTQAFSKNSDQKKVSSQKQESSVPLKNIKYKA